MLLRDDGHSSARCNLECKRKPGDAAAEDDEVELFHVASFGCPPPNAWVRISRNTSIASCRSRLNKFAAKQMESPSTCVMLETTPPRRSDVLMTKRTAGMTRRPLLAGTSTSPVPIS